MLSPILLPNQKKNERQTKGLRAFYLVETNCGARGLIGELDPASLNRVQRSVSESAPRSNKAGELFHAVYWSDVQSPTLNLEGTETRSDGSRISRVSENSQSDLIRYWSQTSACLIGAESRLEAAIAAGKSSVPVALWHADDPKLPWLACHRVIRDVEWYQSGWMVCLGREHMFFRDVTAELLKAGNGDGAYEAKMADEFLRPAAEEAVTLLAISKDGAWRIHSQAGWADGILEYLHPSLRETAVVQLHSILLPQGLSLSPTDGSQENRITVVHDSIEAIAALNEGAQVAYLLSPIRSAKLQELVQHGQMLPAESVALDVAALEGWINAK